MGILLQQNRKVQGFLNPETCPRLSCKQQISRLFIQFRICFWTKRNRYGSVGRLCFLQAVFFLQICYFHLELMPIFKNNITNLHEPREKKNGSFFFPTSFSFMYISRREIMMKGPNGFHLFLVSLLFWCLSGGLSCLRKSMLDKGKTDFYMWRLN